MFLMVPFLIAEPGQPTGWASSWRTWRASACWTNARHGKPASRWPGSPALLSVGARGTGCASPR